MQSWGYVKISRKAYATDTLWLEARRYSKWEAWEDMIQMAAFRKHVRLVGVEMVTLHRGELLASLRYLARRWRWGIKAVRSFLELLASSERIRAQREAQSGTVYLLLNYAGYQDRGTAKGTPRTTAGAHPGHTKGTKKKAVKKERKEEKKYTQEFEEAWTAYPKRFGTNSKQAAYRQWCARIAEGVTTAAMLAGVRRYADESKESAGTRFIKQAATFLGRDRHFEYDVAPSNGRATKRAPQSYEYTPGVSGPAI